MSRSGIRRRSKLKEPRPRRVREAAMGDSKEDREKAAKLPEGDLVRILYTQHALAKDLLDQVESASATTAGSSLCNSQRRSRLTRPPKKPSFGPRQSTPVPTTSP